ncbi:hypothetical protein ACFX13_032935 [Malus domestica]
MLSLSQVLFPSTGEVKVEGVVVEKVLVELLYFIPRRDVTVTVQGLEGSTVEERLQIDIRRVPGEGRVDRDPGGRGPQDGGDVQDGGTNGTKGKDHCVGG